MKNYILLNRYEISNAIGVGIGFLNFYILYYSWGVSWEISFAHAFTLGYLSGDVLDFFLDKEHGRTEIQKISEAVNDFEKKEWPTLKDF